ncbi:hypothetical protein [Shigella sonnei]|nr:hypothetical protein [Shigella sonnei]
MNDISSDDIFLLKQRLAERQLKTKPLLKSLVDWPPESPDNQYHLNK